MAKRRGRRVTGILLLDKPAGDTSNQALQRAKQLFNARKAGHTGSLDPLATGLLPICFGDATKVSGFLLDADKRYRVTCRLGVATTTGDAEGEETERTPVPDMDAEAVERVLAAFRGEIEQMPPMYSAIKHKGERLYRLARQGIEVDREPRKVRIFDLELVARQGDDMELDVRCSKGTYIRTLAEDIGRAFGTVAHVCALRRTALGPYEEPRMWTFEELEQLMETGERLESALLPIDSALSAYPAIELADDMAHFVLQGQPVFVPKTPTEGWLRLYQRDGRFLGMGCVLDDGRVAPKRLLAAG